MKCFESDCLVSMMNVMITMIINFYHNNAPVYIILRAVLVKSRFVNIYDANCCVLLDALTRFDVYYKLVNICICYSCVEFAIRDDYHEQISSLSKLFTILIIIFRINYKLKLLFGIISVGFYTLSFQITQSSNSITFGMNIDWRVVVNVISTFISTNFFHVIKEYVGRGTSGGGIVKNFKVYVSNATRLELFQLNVNLLENDENSCKGRREERIINFESDSMEYSENLGASAIIRHVCDKFGYNISIGLDITKVMIFKRNLSQKLATILGIIIYIIIVYITREKFCQEIFSNLSMCWLGIISSRISTLTFILLLLFLNFNYQIVLFETQRFETWWVVFDVFLMQTLIRLLNKWIGLIIIKNITCATCYYREVLFYFDDVFLIPLCVTMIQGILIATYSNKKKKTT